MLDSFSFYLQSVTAYGLMALISPITFRCVLMHLLISLREWIDCIIDKILNYHSIKEHLKLSKMAKFCCEMLKPCEICKFCIFVLRTENSYQYREKGINFSCVIQKDTKFANFTGLYFSHFTTFYNILQPNFAILLSLRCSLLL